MWLRIAAVLSVLGLLVAFGLGYLPRPAINDAAEYAIFELARQIALGCLFAVWGAILLYWRLKRHERMRLSTVGLVLAGLGLLGAIMLDCHTAPIQVLGYFTGASPYEIGRQYALPLYYHIFTTAVFSLLVVGITVACWKASSRRAFDGEQSLIEAAEAGTESHVEPCDGTVRRPVREKHKRAPQRA